MYRPYFYKNGSIVPNTHISDVIPDLKIKLNIFPYNSINWLLVDFIYSFIIHVLHKMKY